MLWDKKEPLVSHYNNQYDAVGAFALHYLRSGDRRWFSLMRNLANHVVDIDNYHTELDKSAYNGGLFWHTTHYVDAGTSSHRTYPNAQGVTGGGPSPDHSYSSGLLLVFFLTGNRLAYEAVIGLGDHMLATEDGSRTKFRFLDRKPTGNTSMSGSPYYHGPSRSPANAIEVLLNAFDISGSRKYMDLAEILIRRCIHPQDNINARNLLNIEERWFYTMFLRSVGVYLVDT